MTLALRGALVTGVVAVLAAGGAVAPAFPAGAQPSVPSTFYGSASIDGASVPDGTPVRAYIDGKDCTQTGLGLRGTVRDGVTSAYVISVMHESMEPGCGRAGKTITFTVGGQPAGQEGRWKAGPEKLNLNAGSGRPAELPTPTATPPTPAAATPQAPAGSATNGGPGTAPTAPGQASPAGTPPLDNIPLPFPAKQEGAIPLPASTMTPAAQAADDNGGGGWLLIVVPAVLAVGVGTGAGVVLARRRGRS